MVRKLFINCLCFCVFAVSQLVNGKNIGGYYWRGAVNLLPVKEINANLLTHINYAFVAVEEDGSITIPDYQRKGSVIDVVKDISKLKDVNPNLKILFSVADKNNCLSSVVANETLRQSFVEHATSLLKEYNYDGIDLDWEFPKANDTENFLLLLKELREEFDKHDYLLTAAVRAIPYYKNSGYNVTEMVKYLDIINDMTYDFFGSWSNHTGENSPLYPASSDSSYERSNLNVQASVNMWLEAGAPKEKLNIGIPFYGRTFTLADPENHGLKAPVTGAGTVASPSYYQILTKYSNFTTVWNDEQKTPYAYKDDQWLGFDNRQSVTEKVKYALEQDLAGVFVWQLAGDDVQGEYSGIRQELLTTINDVMKLGKTRRSKIHRLSKNKKLLKHTEKRS